MKKKIDLIKRDKIAGSIFGFAIGDAMGATTEFMEKEEIERQFPNGVKDIIGGGWLSLDAGQVTDDTQMSICVMKAFEESCKKNKFFLESNFSKEIKNEFVKWLETNPKDVGCQCRMGINCLMAKSNKAYRNDNALGNGSLMRAMPLAIVNEKYLNVLQGEMTHNNCTCSKIIKDYHKIIQEYLDGKVFKNRKVKLLEPTGFIKSTFNNSLYWSNKDTFEESIIGAVNHGGDADTIAAITGSISGAKFGYKNIPTRWIKQLSPNVIKKLNNYKIFVYNYLQI